MQAITEQCAANVVHVLIPGHLGNPAPKYPIYGVNALNVDQVFAPLIAIMPLTSPKPDQLACKGRGHRSPTLLQGLIVDSQYQLSRKRGCMRSRFSLTVVIDTLARGVLVREQVRDTANHQVRPMQWLH